MPIARYNLELYFDIQGSGRASRAQEILRCLLLVDTNDNDHNYERLGVLSVELYEGFSRSGNSVVHCTQEEFREMYEVQAEETRKVF